MYVYVHMYIYIYTYICIYMYTCVYVYIYCTDRPTDLHIQPARGDVRREHDRRLPRLELGEHPLALLLGSLGQAGGSQPFAGTGEYQLPSRTAQCPLRRSPVGTERPSVRARCARCLCVCARARVGACVGACVCTCVLARESV